MSSLLGADEPPPFEVIAGSATSEYVILCDHASRRIPRVLGSLGLPAAELERHIAWDIGAADVARALARKLDAWLILQNYSRLVIDCNRRLDRPDSIAKVSEDTPIPGNQGLSAEHARERALALFEPYHACIREELDARAARGVRSILVFMHSFTPCFRDVTRPWHAGVLFHRDERLARPLLDALRRDPELSVGENQPYAATALSDYGIVEHAEQRGLLHVEFEVRQDLVTLAAGQEAWAERLASLFREVVSNL